jgi:hypothetical protein
MASEADRILRATDKPIVDENESDSPMVSTSSNAAAAKIVDKIIPKMSDYWKKSTIIEEDCQAYHSAGCLTGDLVSHSV